MGAIIKTNLVICDRCPKYSNIATSQLAIVHYCQPLGWGCKKTIGITWPNGKYYPDSIPNECDYRLEHLMRNQE